MAKNVKTPENIESYGKNYSDDGLWNKLASVAKKAGLKVVYLALILFYALKSPDTSAADRTIIIGALGYFILPVDLVPDFIPVAGYGDDLGALLWAVARVAKNITPAVKQQAKDKLHDWFGDYDQSKLNDIA